MSCVFLKRCSPGHNTVFGAVMKGSDFCVPGESSEVQVCVPKWAELVVRTQKKKNCVPKRRFEEERTQK